MRAAGDSSDQYLPGEARGVTYVSRLQSVQAAIAAQIEVIKAVVRAHGTLFSCIAAHPPLAIGTSSVLLSSPLLLPLLCWCAWRQTPKRRVALVAFSGEVTIYGDCSREPKVLAGDRLKDYNFLITTATEYAVTLPVSGRLPGERVVNICRTTPVMCRIRTGCL